MPRSHPRPVARGGRRALPVSPSHGARTAVSKWSPVGWGSLRPLPNGRQRHCRPSRGVVGAGVARGRASSPPVHLRSTRRAASAPRPGRGFRRGSEACIEGVHRDVHRVCSVRIGCVPKSEMGVCACYYDPHAKTCTVCSDRRRLMAFISLNARFAEHRTRLVCLGVSPSPRVRCPVGMFYFTFLFFADPRDPTRDNPSFDV